MRSFFRFATFGLATLAALVSLNTPAGWSNLAQAQDVVRNENPNGLPVPTGDGWQALFNGTDLSGWQQKNGWAVYRVVDGTVVGTTSKHSPNSFLCTAQEYDDFLS